MRIIILNNSVLGVIPVANTIVLQNDTAATTTSATKVPRIAWNNLLSTATTKPASSGALYDGMTSVLYTAASATITLDFTFSSTQSVSFGAVAGAAFGTYATTFEFYTWDGAAWVKQADISGMRDNQPVMLPFTAVSTSQVRFKFISNASGLTIGEIAAGATIDFPKPVSVGYQPGKWTSRNRVTTNDTQSNAIGRSTTIERGTEERVNIPNVPYTWMNSNWTSFVRDAQGYPIWFAWNAEDFPTDVIFGRWQANDPTFTSSLYSEVDLTIRGQV